TSRGPSVAGSRAANAAGVQPALFISWFRRLTATGRSSVDDARRRAVGEREHRHRDLLFQVWASSGRRTGSAKTDIQRPWPPWVAWAGMLRLRSERVRPWLPRSSRRKSTGEGAT